LDRFWSCMTHMRIPAHRSVKSEGDEVESADTRRPPALAAQYPHYYKELPENVTHVDVHRVVDLFGVRRSAVGHAIKKLLCSGQRGVKDEVQDLHEARQLIARTIEMIEEETGLNAHVGG
jgi:hypothetical protein